MGIGEYLDGFLCKEQEHPNTKSAMAQTVLHHDIGQEECLESEHALNYQVSQSCERENDQTIRMKIYRDRRGDISKIRIIRRLRRRGGVIRHRKSTLEMQCSITVDGTVEMKCKPRSSMKTGTPLHWMTKEHGWKSFETILGESDSCTFAQRVQAGWPNEIRKATGPTVGDESNPAVIKENSNTSRQNMTIPTPSALLHSRKWIRK